MAIGFSQGTVTSRRPFVHVEIDPTGAGATGQRFRTLLIGQRLGGVKAGVPRAMGNEADGVAAWGQGSMLAGMVGAFRRQTQDVELWAVALDDAAGATKATTEVTVTAAATGAGTIALYIAGRRVPVNVIGATTVNNLATAIAAAINARPFLPVTAAAAAAVVTITARHGGTASDIDVRVNYHPDESLPPGVALDIAAGTAGAGDPDIMDALAAFADQKFDLIVSPYTAVAQIAVLEDDLAARFGPASRVAGQAITAYRGAGGTVAQATTYGDARNSPHVTVMGMGKTPMPAYEWAAMVTGQVAPSAAEDPALPFHDLELIGALAPAVQDRWSDAEREALLHDGIATSYVDEGGKVRIERMITTYQTAPGGAVDEAYLDLNTPLTLNFMREDFRARIRRKFSRYKLANDGARFAPGQRVITPSRGRAEAVAWGREMEARGLLENFEQFKADVACARNPGDVNGLDWSVSPDLVNQFRTGRVRIGFLL